MDERIIKIYDLKTKIVTEHVISIQTVENHENQSFLWTLQLKIDNIILKSEPNYLLFYALEQIRTQLENIGKLIIVRGADCNVGMSGMQADMTKGAAVTKHEFDNKIAKGELTLQDLPKYIYNILDESRIENVSSITGLTLNYKTEIGNMKTIWKIELAVESYQEIELPKDSKILTARTLDNMGYIWFQFETSNEKNKEIRKFITITTGDKFEREGEFIGTLFYNEGKIVQHLYEI